MRQEKTVSNTDLYDVADLEIIFNDNDPDLKGEIHYALPECPAWDTIDGYGLHPSEQFFKWPVFTRKLKDLMARRDLTATQKIKVMEANADFYEVEIEMLSKEWDRIENGYWFWNSHDGGQHSKPHYISGCHYFYLVYWNMDVGHPDFRMRDREFFLFVLMSEQNPYCYGVNYPKNRREGATSKVTCWRYWTAITGSGKHCGLQSKTEDDAEKVHQKHLLFAWRKMPFWVYPVFDGNLESSNAINFFGTTTRSSPDFGLESLESWLDYENAGENAYDSTKLHAIHQDEIGKTVGTDVEARWVVLKPCLEQGSTKIGIALNTSTVEEMDEKGGKQFQNLCNDSYYHEADEITRTTATGLFNFFIPSDEGLEGLDPATHPDKKFQIPFIDKHGYCDKARARRFLLANRDKYRRRGNMKMVIDLTRQFPLEWKECWLRSAKRCQFNLEKIENRLDKFRNGNALEVRGNFEWVNNIPDTKVEFIPSDVGKFYVSFLFEHEQFSNLQTMDNGVRVPGNILKFVAGGDPFKFTETIGADPSKGGGAVLWKYDETIDDPRTPRSEWKSCRFVCTYDYRPLAKDIYGEDMLKMCVYYGCEMFSEINVDLLWEYFAARGYGGYLFYRTNARGTLLKTPGAQTSNKIKEDIFTETQYHIEMNCERECHVGLLEQWKKIEGPVFMTDYDLFTAAGFALLGAKKSVYNPDRRPPEETYALDEYMDEYEIAA